MENKINQNNVSTQKVDTDSRVLTVDQLSAERVGIILLLRNVREFRSVSFIMFSKSRGIDQYTDPRAWWSFRPLWQVGSGTASTLFKKVTRGYYQITEAGERVLKKYENLKEQDLLAKHYASKYDLRSLRAELEKIEKEVGGAV